MDDSGTVLERHLGPDADGLAHLCRHLAERFADDEVLGVLESRDIARFSHGTLELACEA